MENKVEVRSRRATTGSLNFTIGAMKTYWRVLSASRMARSVLRSEKFPLAAVRKVDLERGQGGLLGGSRIQVRDEGGLD